MDIGRRISRRDMIRLVTAGLLVGCRPNGQPAATESGVTVITPTGQSLTLFVRGHSKWPRYSEANFNLDGLSLRGVPGAASAAEPSMPITGRTEVNWVPIVALIVLLLILFREGWRGVDRLREEI